MMKAKMNVTAVHPYADGVGETVNMSPVCGKAPFGPNGESEDNTFSRWTPGGSLSLSITNPALVGKFHVGQKFYLDFTEAAE
jgi:hypothetical protein